MDPDICRGKCCELGSSNFFLVSFKWGRFRRELQGLAAPPQWKLPPLSRRQFSSPFANYVSLGSVFAPKALFGCFPFSECALLRYHLKGIPEASLHSRKIWLDRLKPSQHPQSPHKARLAMFFFVMVFPDPGEPGSPNLELSDNPLNLTLGPVPDP